MDFVFVDKLDAEVSLLGEFRQGNPGLYTYLTV
jgi:hypothetical protein